MRTVGLARTIGAFAGDCFIAKPVKPKRSRAEFIKDMKLRGWPPELVALAEKAVYVNSVAPEPPAILGPRAEPSFWFIDDPIKPDGPKATKEDCDAFMAWFRERMPVPHGTVVRYPTVRMHQDDLLRFWR